MDFEEAEKLLSNLREPLIAAVHSDSDAYWETAAWSTIELVARHLLVHSKSEPSLGDVFRICTDDEDLVRLADKNVDDNPAWTAVADLTCTQRTWSCVKSEIQGMLAFFGSQLAQSVARGASTVDFARDFFDESRPTAIYLQVPDTNDLGAQYASLFMSHAYRAFASGAEKRKSDTRGLTIIIDEFARYTFKEMPSIMATGRSRGVRCLFAMQSFSQFMERRNWSEHEARVITEQAGASIMLGNTSPEWASHMEFASGGLIGRDYLMALPQGAAYVSVAGKPCCRTQFLTSNEVAKNIRTAQKKSAARRSAQRAHVDKRLLKASA